MKNLYLTILIVFLLGNTINIHSQDSINKVIPTEILLKKNTFHNFIISPDGKYFANVNENDFGSEIIVVDIDGYKLHKRIPVGKRTKIRDLRWLTSNRLIYQISGSILAVNIDGTESAIIIDSVSEYPGEINFSGMLKTYRYNSILNLLADNKKYILTQNTNHKGYASVKKVNIFTGQEFPIIDGSKDKIHKWIADENGHIKLGLRFKDDEIQFLEKNELSDTWEPIHINLNDKNIPIRINPKSLLTDNLSYEGMDYNEDILYLSTSIDSDRVKLISYDLKKKKIIEVLAKDDHCDISVPILRKPRLIFNDVSKKIAGIRYESIRPKFIWFDDQFKKHHQTINTSYPEYVNDFIDTDSKNERILVHQWNDVSKGNIGVYDTKANTYKEMTYLNEDLDTYELSKTINITLFTKDGHQLHGYLNPPINNTTKKNKSLIVIPHGGPWIRDYWELDEFSQFFATRGYAVLRINFRGSTGFGKEHVLAGFNNIDTIMIDDIADATEHVIKSFSIDPSKVFLFGHSYGGYATYMSILKYPKLYAGGVAVSAPTNLKKWLKERKKRKQHFTYDFWNTVLGSKESKYLLKISPVTYAENFEKPLFIFHGNSDNVISSMQAQEMHDKLKKNKKDVSLEILKRQGHSINNGNSMGYILNASKDFFEQITTQLVD